MRCDAILRDGESSAEESRVNQTWVDDACVLHVWDGTDWVLYEDLPFFEPDPLYRDT